MKRTIRQRINRAIDDKHGLRLSPTDVIDLDRLLPPLPKIYHTVSQDPFMLPYGKGLLREAYEAQNVASTFVVKGLENNPGYVPYGIENAVKPNWELPPVVIYTEDKKSTLGLFKEKAKRYTEKMNSMLCSFFYRSGE